MPRKKSAGRRFLGKPVSRDPDDAPELLDDFFKYGEVRDGERMVRRGRPPLGAVPKQPVTMRLDADVIAAYRALGAGWQSQVNADLRRARKLKKAG